MPIRFRKDLARVALDSVEQYTPVDHEVIVVHEGTEEDVKSELQGRDVKYCHNPVPKGYPGAINTGLKLVSSDATHVLLLNSDVVATPGWLEEMLVAFKKFPNAGVVCPTYTESEGIQSVDMNFEEDDYSVMEWGQLKGVCVLMPRAVVEALVVSDGHLLDERFGLGGGDDNDLAYRVTQMKKDIICARKAYIFHYNSASFREIMTKESSRQFAPKQFRKFQEKHGLNNKPSVTVAVPSFSGTVHCQLARTLMLWMGDPEVVVHVRFYENLAPLDNARNQAVKDFLEGYDDYLCFIDDDIVPPPNTLRELLAADKDVIAPLCFTMKQTNSGLMAPMPVAHRYNKDGEYEPYYGKGVEETDVVTGGMHLVKRHVFESMDRPYAFTYHANGTVIYSEDFYFSRQCQEKGIKLYTHYGLPCKHIRQADIKNINDLCLEVQQFTKP